MNVSWPVLPDTCDDYQILTLRYGLHCPFLELFVSPNYLLSAFFSVFVHFVRRPFLVFSYLCTHGAHCRHITQRFRRQYVIDGLLLHFVPFALRLLTKLFLSNFSSSVSLFLSHTHCFNVSEGNQKPDFLIDHSWILSSTRTGQ